MVVRPGRRARWVAVRAAYGGGAVGSAGALGYGLLRAEARLARRTIGTPTELAPQAAGSWGRGRGPALHLTVLGDSSAAGLGCDTAEQTPAALLAGGLARELGRPVRLDVTAVIGARAADLDAQVSRALVRRVDLAVVMVGANDVTHGTATGQAARELAGAVTALRDAGAQVLVGTCPDLGTVKPLWQPLRTYAALVSRRMARAQTVAVVEAGGTAISLGDLLGPEFSGSPQLWSADRFHPSAAGYARVVDVLLPTALTALGREVAGPVRDSVENLSRAAYAASRDPGLAVEAGPGRLARLARRVPLVGRGEPEGRTPQRAEASR